MFNVNTLKNALDRYVERHAKLSIAINYIEKYAKRKATQYALIALASSILTMSVYVQDSVETIVDSYCILSESQRHEIRKITNDNIYPNYISIICEGDSDDDDEE